MSYNLKSLNLPKLKGTALKVMASLLGKKPTRALLAPSLLKNGGISDFREWGISAQPLHRPIDLYGLNGQAPKGDGTERLKAFIKSREGQPKGQVRRLHAAFLAGEMTPKDVIFQIFEAIDKDTKGRHRINAVIAMNKEEVLSMAEAAAIRYMNQQPLSVLDGIPIFIKDEMHVAGYETTVGTRFLSNGVEAEDATLVKRLRDLGAIIMGKTNLHEIGINPTGYNDRFGPVSNPYMPTHDPGGSSSGSAAAVAAGWCPIAIGADGGGSIRIPAAFCGVAGLKATYGRISEHGVFPLCHSVGHVGPIASTVEDCVIGYLAIAGVDAHDEVSQRQGPMKPVKTMKDMSNVKIGVFEPWANHADEDMRHAYANALRFCEEQGATIIDIDIPGLNEMRVGHAVTILSEMTAAMQNHQSNFGQHGASVRASLAIGQSLTGRDYVRAQMLRREAAAVFDKVFAEVDVILTPATGIVAPEVRHS